MPEMAANRHARSSRFEWNSCAPMGVGVLFNPALSEYMESHAETIDYVVIIPDMFQNDRGMNALPRFSELEIWTPVLEQLGQQWPIVAHNIGMSLGSAASFDEEYLMRVAHWNS